ncbi:hypothetical protein VTK26DRAFT_7078 [Humicola hyalothermophila]
MIYLSRSIAPASRSTMPSIVCSRPTSNRCAQCAHQHRLHHPPSAKPLTDADAGNGTASEGVRRCNPLAAVAQCIEHNIRRVPTSSVKKHTQYSVPRLWHFR